MLSDTTVFVLSRPTQNLIHIINQDKEKAEKREAKFKEKATVIPFFILQGI